MNDLSKPSQIIVKTLAGCENLLINELNELGYKDVFKLTRAVKLEGDWNDVFKINYLSRFSLNVLVNISNFTVNDYDDIYKGGKEIFWAHYLTNDDTFLIRQSVTSQLFSHSQQCSLKLKDAIVDVFKEKTGNRPSVNKDHPDFIFHLHIHDNKAQVLLDTTGVSLYRRGYKLYQGLAPLNEILAAALVKWSGWEPSSRLVDLFAGSGTILTEAYLQAIQRPAGYYRSNYAFMRFRSFDRAEWERFRFEENKKEKPIKGIRMQAFEINSRSLEGMQKNLSNIGALEYVDIKKGNAMEEYRVEENDVLVTNPPYGKRIEPMDAEFIRSLSGFIKHQCPGVKANFILPVDLANSFGFRPKYKHKVFNGEIECLAFGFDVFKGKKNQG